MSKKPVKPKQPRSSSTTEQERPPPPSATWKPKRAPSGRPFQPGKSGNPATQFKPGKSGNPGGVPKSMKEIRATELEHVPKILDALRTMGLRMNGSPAVQACDKYLDRIVGKAPQPITGADGGPLKVTHETIMAKLTALEGDGMDVPDRDTEKPVDELAPVASEEPLKPGGGEPGNG